MASARGLRSHAQAALALALAIIGAAAVAGCSASAATRHLRKGSLQTNYEQVIKEVLPSVVEIKSGDSTGSGVVFNKHGDIVTNLHVLGSDKKLTVYSSAASESMKAHVVGTFAPDDLAVIKVNTGAFDLKPATWANSAKTPDGAIVLAMGSPYGLADSVTQGIVSATGRTVTGPSGHNEPTTVLSDAIQTSAAINPGNSGGALVLLSGAVLGIPTLSATDPEIGGVAPGIGFAIPSDTVRKIVPQLVATGKVKDSGRASLGITGSTFANSRDQPSGVTVQSATPNGAADAAGIKRGDVIIGIDHHAVKSMNDLEVALTYYKPGNKVQVELLRDGNPKQTTARLGTLRS
jgi:putative serine protease PepD